MDSITQFALGSAIGVAVMGRKTKVWKAALIGGLYGTLPDLDAFIDHGDPIRNMTYHRGETHAFFYQILAAPIFAWLMTRLPAQRENFRHWLLAILLIFITHSLIDWMTVYGTQLTLPFLERSYGMGSIFIIDPLYTVPLLIGLLVTCLHRGESRLRWNKTGLILSTLYMVWTIGAQAHVRSIAADSLQAQNIEAQQILVTPTAFNTVLWRVLAMTENGYAEGFYSLRDPESVVLFTRYQTDPALRADWKDNWYVQRIDWFSNGFFKLEHGADGKVVLTDLRMGQEPYYSFNFALETEDGKPAHTRSRPAVKQMLAWTGQRMSGNPEGLKDFMQAYEESAASRLMPPNPPSR